MAVETEADRRREAPAPGVGESASLGRTPTRESNAPRVAARLRTGRRRLLRVFAFSPLTRRILLLNVAALVALGVGLGYLGEYQQSLTQSELESLRTQARIFAGALGESAVKGEGMGAPELQAEQSRMLLRRLLEPTRARARLFTIDGAVVADSRLFAAPGGFVQVEPLPPPEANGTLGPFAERAYAWLLRALSSLGTLPPYKEQAEQHAADYGEVMKALAGFSATNLYSNAPHGMILSVAVPVQRYKRVVGALMVSQDSAEIDRAMRSVRLDILKAFGLALFITVLFSFYLGSTIVRPIRRLALAAERIGPGKGRPNDIPDFAKRRDEIGDLSGALRRMTALLSHRMEAIERFAADVAHEIKNPLSSLRSAVETAARVKDPAQQRQLMTIILEDVERLDRLISDISTASRLDAELSRATAEYIDVKALLETLVEIHNESAAPEAPQLRMLGRPDSAATLECTVHAVEARLAQVFRNLIANAISFSPQRGVITLSVRLDGEMVEAIVEDEGPGLPEGKFDAIFERFYTERPAGEKFGIHSGLGLSISKQIVEAHGGTIRAENRRDRTGRVRGARFIVRLPVAADAPQTED